MMLSSLPGWIVDDATSIREEVADWRALSAALETAGVPYAIGGALALAIAGVPRGTADVDVNVLLAVRPELDRTYVRCWIVDMMGDEDERVRRWDEMVSRHAAG